MGGLTGLRARLRSTIEGMVAELSDVYRRALIPTPFEVYTSRLVTATMVSFAASAVALALLFRAALGFPWVGAIALGATAGAAVASTVLLALVYYPYYVAKSRGEAIRSSLIYTLSYMTAIAAAGVIPERIFERVAEIDPSREVRREALRILRDVKMLGYDTIAALKNRIDTAPSPALQEFYSGLRNVIVMGGDLREYLSFYLRRLFKERSEELARLTSALATVSEIYITLLVAGPIITIVMLSIMDIVGGRVFDLPPTLLMLMFLSLFIPFSALVILIIVDMIMSRV
ncbi:MAG: hypothetical protein DRJ56_06085 [Thermoprotei archaeon]|nr:MAG: hypothetical protein DRJ56_06085 [Thermoprotei archaeon]